MTAPEPVWGLPFELPVPPSMPARAEVVVIGGGITGVALLDVLLRRDVDAVLLERDHLAAGASGRNAGFLLAGVAENYARAVHRYGRATAAEVWAFTMENHRLVAAIAATVDGGHRVRGSVVAAIDSAEAASLEASAALLAEDGLPGAISAVSDVPGVVRTLVNPTDGEVDPARLVRGLGRAHADRVYEGRAAVAVEDGQNGAVVRLHEGSIEAATVVLATNAWAAQLAPSLPITPVRAQMLAAGPAPRLVTRPVYADWGHRYWRQRDDGVVLVGGFRHRAVEEEVGYELTTTEVVQGHLEDQLHDLGVTSKVTHRWAGTMGFSFDGLPLAGRVPGMRRVHVCAGYTGHGMGFAVNAATALARQLIDNDRLPAWLDTARLPAC